MKLPKTGVFTALLTFCCLLSFAQTSTPPLKEPDYNKPKIFSDLPDRLRLQLANAEALLNLRVGAQVSTQLATGFTLVGTVISVSNAADASVKTVVVKSSARQGAVLTFSRIKKGDGTYTYIGRMLSVNVGDALEIVREGTEYIIRKKGLYDFIAE
jgi:hypothetical protein